MIDLSKINGFDWDTGNIDKNLKKHGISTKEAEEVFLDEDLAIERDIRHQEIEERYIAVGKSFARKILFIIFTFRKEKIRIISARIANKKERRIYAQNAQKNPKIQK